MEAKGDEADVGLNPSIWPHHTSSNQISFTAAEINTEAVDEYASFPQTTGPQSEAVYGILLLYLLYFTSS